MASVSIKEFSNVDNSGAANVRAWRHYFLRAKLLCTNMFLWDNLPNNIDKEFIELNLFDNGQLAFFKDTELGFMITKCAPSGELNFYDRPISYNCYGIGYNKKVAANDLVIIRNNILEYPTWTIIQFFINRLWDTQRSIDVNMHNVKTPVIVQCQESQRLTMKNMFMQYDGNIPAILANKDLDLDGVKVLKLEVPFIADKLWEIKDKIWTELLETIGINNANTHKKERLITDEVNANNQLIDICKDTFLSSRQEAIDKINEKFGTSISVEVRESFNTETNGEEVSDNE